MLHFTDYPLPFASVTVPYSSSKCCFELICSRHNPVWSKWWILSPTDPQSPLWTCCGIALLFTISSQLHTAWIVSVPLLWCLSTCPSGTPLQSCLCCLCDWSAWIGGLFFSRTIENLNFFNTTIVQKQNWCLTKSMLFMGLLSITPHLQRWGHYLSQSSLTAHGSKAIIQTWQDGWTCNTWE